MQKRAKQRKRIVAFIIAGIFSVTITGMAGNLSYAGDKGNNGKKLQNERSQGQCES